MIIVKNRELIIPREEFNIGTNYDTNTEVRSFTLPRVTTGGVDLASLSFKLDIKYANGGLDSSDLVKETTEDSIVLTWTITSSMLQVPGTVLIQLRATDEDGNVKWTSYQGATFVEDAINVPAHYEGSLSELEQLESRVTSVLEGESSRVAAEEARAEAESGRVTAEEGRVSAEQSRVEAEQSRVDTEAQRVATFNANEAQRASTFATNEAARQSVAEGTESQRASTFNTNEQGRINTFNANEADRENRVATLEQGYTQTSLMAKSYAVGGTGIRPGEDTDNAKYYKEQASSISIGSLGATNEKLYFGDTKSGSAGGDVSSVVALNSSGVARTYQLKDNEARTLAGNAQTAADAAQGTANTAVSNASAAQSTANTAVRNASTAQSTADGAVTAAGNAQALADQNARIVSNDNLLDNPFFTVNQRGVTTWSSGYGVDRWRANGSNVTCTISNGLLSFTTASTFAGIVQFLESERLVIGKQYTASVMLSDGTIKSGTFTASTSGTISISSIDSNWLLRILYDSSLWKLSIINTSGVNASLSVKAMKLEKGSVSTLANDSIPPYAPTLLECQRYFVRFSGASANYYVGCGMCNTSTELVVHIPYPTRMRAVPAASLMAASKYSVFIANGYAKTVTAVNPLLRGVDFATLAVTTSGLTVGQAANLGFPTAGNYIDFSADL